MQRRVIRNASFVYERSGRGGAEGRFVGFDVLGRRFGFDRSTVYVGFDRYLDRWILYVAGYTLRLHRFWRGDDDRASHTHPWWFVTFPLAAYYERVYHNGCYFWGRHVRAWRFHYRPANFEHYVVERSQVYAGGPEAGSWWTIVLTGRKVDTWGFYPEPGKFVNWKDWK